MIQASVLLAGQLMPMILSGLTRRQFRLQSHQTTFQHPHVPEDLGHLDLETMRMMGIWSRGEEVMILSGQLL